MKKSLLLISCCALAAISTNALKIKQLGKALAQAPAPKTVYYHTPEGITFSGFDKNLSPGGDYAYARAAKWYNTAAEVSPEGTKFQWTFPDDNGVSETATTVNFQFRMRSEGTFPAPTLSAGGDSYTLAPDGIKYGSYGTWEHFAVNYQSSQTTIIDQANEILAVNDATARANLNMVMAGGIFSDIEILGFAESFYDNGSFWLEAANAVLVSDKPLAAADVAVKVFKRVKTSVYTEEIAQLTTAEVTAIGNNRYFVTFRCDEPAYITTALQVVVLPAEGSTAAFSPALPLQKYYRDSNMGTCSLYSNFKFGGKQATRQYLDFYGTECTDEHDNTTGFLNHWAIGIKGSFDKPAGITDAIADTDSPDDPVYTTMGVRAGTRADMPSLAPGIYICKGKKYLIK